MKKNTIKKVFLTTLSLFSIMTLTPIKDVSAIEFKGQEDKYMSICSSNNISNSNKSTCEQFSKYLKNKNKDLKSQLEKEKKEVETTSLSITSVQNELSNLISKIEAKEKEIKYTESQIINLEADIENKNQLVKDRMYATQGINNSNTMIDFVFGSANFTDFFSRVDSINELTQSDKDLIEDITKQKEELKTQKANLELAKQNIEAQKKQQEILKAEYEELLNKQKQNIVNSQDAIAENTKDANSLDKALSDFYEKSKKDDVGKVSQIATQPGNGSTATGVSIANAALSKQGSRYYWGATGPTYFDCSGLVYWAHNQAGIKIGRTTAAGYANSGKAVAYSQLQVGDVITFDYGRGVAHIGIYIGNGQMVHASGKGSTTFGQYADQCVKVTSIAPGSYFYNYINNCRRLY